MQRLFAVVVAVCLYGDALAQKTSQALQDSVSAPFFFAPVTFSKTAFQAAPIARDAAAKHLPFFCEQERLLDKKLPVPLRFRIGNQQQADWLEGKPAAVRPQP